MKTPRTGLSQCPTIDVPHTSNVSRVAPYEAAVGVMMKDAFSRKTYNTYRIY
jgi:hypothetical protein